MLRFDAIGITILCVLFTMFSTRQALSQDYNKREDYVFNFEKTQAKSIEVFTAKNKLEIPVLAEKYQTAFLEVDIRTSIGVRFRQPYLEVVADNLIARQYFEFGAKGIRYINLSDFVVNASQNIRIKTKHCRVKGDKKRLMLFKNSPVEQSELLVLAPHPDDAEIAAYGLYAANKNATIVNITVGDAGKKMYDELYESDTTHSIKKANLRLWNSITVPLLAGLDPQNCINLGYFDATLKSMAIQPDKPVKPRYTGIEEVSYFREQNISSFLDTIQAEATWNSLVSDLKHIISIKNPTIIATPYPAIDVHSDHKLTTMALLQALHELNYPNIQLYLYTNHYTLSEMYPCGKKGSLIALPPLPLGTEVYFDALYSQPLNEVCQGDKTLALEAMNPLRPDTEWHTTLGSWRLFAKTFRENIRNTEQDYYYRRAVRKNELFFVVNSRKILGDEAIYKLVMGDMNFLNE